MSSQSARSNDPFEASRGADRPRAHGGTSDAERAIFEATERLLVDVPLHELSVAQIIGAAGVSRATFYFYFSSKFAVVTGLLAQVMEEIFGTVQPFVEREEGQDPETALRKSLQESTRVWAAHRKALGAVMEHWHAVPELRALWLGVVQRFSSAVAAEIDRERKAGLAPPGPDSRQVAAALIWGTERCLYVAGLGVDENIPREEDLVEPLMALWLGGLYGGQAPPKASRKSAKPPARKPAARKR
jgi:TetR/AcrR family transcriptional regulator, ethionamide resistance regulator